MNGASEPLLPGPGCFRVLAAEASYRQILVLLRAAPSEEDEPVDAKAQAGSLDVSRTVDGDLQLAVRGDFDYALSLQLHEALDESSRSGQVDVALDLSGVTFMDSTGIRVMTLIRSAVQTAGHELRVTAASPTVYRVLEITGLLEQFDVPKPVGNDPTPF